MHYKQFFTHPSNGNIRIHGLKIYLEGLKYSSPMSIIPLSSEVGKVLDARSVLARRYRRQEKGRRLYSILARRKKGKEKISQIE